MLSRQNPAHAPRTRFLTHLRFKCQLGNLYLLPGNVVTGDGEYPGIGMGYTLVLPVTEFTLRQAFEDTRLTVNERNIWAVVPAGEE